MTGHFPDGHPSIPTPKVGLLLINLGTPDGTDYWSMRRYLSEFLSDRRVIEVNPVFWQLLLQGIILTTRPSKSGHAYKAIWNKELDESPLRTITRAQSEKLAARLSGRFPNVMVDWAMRYGQPSLRERIDALQAAGCERILLFALYPQYSATTSATAYDKAFDALAKLRWQPAIRTVPAYHDSEVYVKALAESLTAHLDRLDWTPEVVLASFHGLPKRYLDAGDPYHCHCAKTTRLLREHLGWEQGRLRLTFQSRFGREPWLQPYTDETVDALAQGGVRNLAIISPGFSADCVETLEEIGIGIRESFLEGGGENFTLVPCLNDSEAGLRVIEAVALKELQGWLPEVSAVEREGPARLVGGSVG